MTSKMCPNDNFSEFRISTLCVLLNISLKAFTEVGCSKSLVDITGVGLHPSITMANGKHCKSGLFSFTCVELSAEPLSLTTIQLLYFPLRNFIRISGVYWTPVQKTCYMCDCHISEEFVHLFALKTDGLNVWDV